MPAYEGIAAWVLARTARPTAELRGDLLAGLALVPTAPLLNLAAAHLDIFDGKGAEAQSRLTRLLAAHPDLSPQLRQKAGELMTAAAQRPR
jgi:predicted Zn-dependent protease